MNQPDSAISAELMARFADCARADFKRCLEVYCCAINGAYQADYRREARDDLNSARLMMDLARTMEYW